MGIGDAIDKDDRVSVQVTLDLRSAKPGSYFLATVRGADNGTYYYPLQNQLTWSRIGNQGDGDFGDRRSGPDPARTTYCP